LREESRLRVFVNKVPRIIYGPRRDGVTGVWRRLHNEELNNRYSSANIKSRRMRWAGHVTRMGIAEVYTGFWWLILRKRDHFEYSGVDGRIILRWIFMKSDVGARAGLSWLRIGTGGGHL
jgi:hypothetical protein